MNELKTKIIYERKIKHLTQKDVAAALSLGETTYQSYEHGRCEPPYDVLIRMADFFGVTTDYLLGHEVSENAAIGRRKELRPSTLKLVDATEKLNDMGIAVVLGYVARLIEDNPEFLLPSARLR